MNSINRRRRLRLYVMRHGETARRSDGAICGQTDVGLSPRGIEQSRQLCERLAPASLVAIYCSDLGRARFAADVMARARGLRAVRLPELREIDMGDWEGRSLEEIEATAPEPVARLFDDPLSFQYPGGESFSAFERRVQSGLQRILDAHESGAVAVVTHAGVCRLIIGRILEIKSKNWLRLAQDFGCLNVIDWYGDRPIIQTLNHVGGEVL